MKRLFSVLSILFILAACQKEVEDDDVTPAPGDCLLVKMVQGDGTSPIGDTTFEFSYNDTGRLEHIAMISDDMPGPFPFDLAYDAQGRLIKVSTPYDAGVFYETRISYDNQGRLQELVYHPFSDTSAIIFEYGAGNLPERARLGDYVNSQWKERSIYEYTFSNGNMIKSDYYENGVYKWSHNFEYDLDIPNNAGVLPLASFFSIPLGYYEEFLFFNKNLPKKLDWNGPVDFQNEYEQDSGRVVKWIGTYTNQGAPSQRETRSFFFECK